MHRIRVYVDTSVFGGTQDDEFVLASTSFFDRVRRGEYVVLLSDETQRELADSPDAVQGVWIGLPPASVELIGLDDEARFLADEYVSARVLGAASIGDALHVAAATVAGADGAMTILSPREVGDEAEGL